MEEEVWNVHKINETHNKEPYRHSLKYDIKKQQNLHEISNQLRLFHVQCHSKVSQ